MEKTSRSSGETPTLERTKGAATTFGTEYEIFVGGLLALRSLKKNISFQLFSNVAAAHPLDDLVLRVMRPQPLTIFIQLKHGNATEAARSITTQAFTSPKGDYSLQKYFEFYADFVSQHTTPGGHPSKDLELLHECSLEDVRMVIYTNRPVARRKGAPDGPHLHFPHEDLLRTGGAVFSFGYKDDEVWKLLDNDPPRSDLYQHEFLPRLRVFSEQAHVQAVEQLLRVELDAVFGAPLPWSDALLPQYIAVLKHWALVDARGGALTDGSGEVERLLAAELARQGRAAAGGGALLFAAEHCAALRTALEGGGGEVAVRVRGVPAGHRAAKVVQVLDEALAGRWAYVGDRQLRGVPRAALEAVCGAGRVQLLLLDAEEEAAAARGLAAAAVRCGVRVVAVSSGRGEDEEDWRMDHLTPEAQEAFMDQTLHFQGRPVRLRDLESSWRSLREDVDGALLSALIGEEAAVGVAPLAPGDAEIDLPRILEHPSSLDPGVLGKLDPLSDHLVLTGFPTSFLETLYKTLVSQDKSSGIPETNMRRQAKERHTERNKEDNKTLEKNKWWSVLPAAGEADDQNTAFHSVCEKKAGLNVHWLHCVAERDGSATVAWRATRGSTRAVAPFVQLASDACVREPTCVHAAEAVRHAAAWGRRVGLLVGEPGMGKSRFLQRVAAEARALQAPQRWTVLLQALDHRNLLRDFPEPTDLTQEHLEELLAAAAGVAGSSSSESTQRFHKAALCDSGDIAVLIDGVDEICPLSKDKLLRLLQILLETKVQLVWVSSRPEAALALTEALLCPASALRPFSEAEQKKYLCGHWSSVDPRQRPPAEFEGLASEMVAALRGQRSLLDVPLHVQMAAEAYEAQAAQALGAGVSLLPQTGVSLYQLYRSFVERKRDLFEWRFGLKDANFENLPLANNFEEIHQNCAMLVLVSDGTYSKVDSSAFRDYLGQNRSTLLKEKTGLLWLGEDGMPHFVHYTFIEYFAARWFVSQVRAGESPPEAAKEMWRSLLVGGVGAGVRRVLEQLLADGLPLHRAVLEEDHAALAAALEAGRDPDERDLLGRSALVQAASLGRADAVGALLARGADAGRRDALLGWTALRYASACAHLPAAERLLRAGADPLHFDETNIDLQDTVHEAARYGWPEIMGIILKKSEGYTETQRLSRTPIITAAEFGHTKVVQKLINYGANVKQHDMKKTQSIHYAVSGQHYEITKILLEKNADPNAEDTLKVTPLMNAATSGDARFTELLLEYGADVNRRNKYNMSPLHYATKTSNHQATNLLLAKKADPNAEDRWKVTPLMNAAMSGDARFTELLLEYGADVNRKNLDETTALHYATENRHYEIANLLLAKKADPSAEDILKHTPLMKAAMSGDARFTELLLEYGADVNQKNLDERTALHYATENRHYEVAKLLLAKKADPNAEEKWKCTPLMMAAMSGDARSTVLLLEYGADVNQKNLDESTALHYATENRHYELANLLLTKKADPNAEDISKNTPLMIAAISGDTRSTELLLEYGDVNHRNSDKRTALHFAIENEHYEVAYLLLAKKADPHAEENKKVTPLMMAAMSGDERFTELLLEYGADVNQKNLDERTALHYATANRRYEVAKLLLAKKADPNAKDKLKRTPLMKAAMSGDACFTELLLQFGADVNQRNFYKRTALHYATEIGHYELANLLLTKKADPNAEDKLKHTPLMMAAISGDARFTKLLLEYGADVNQRNSDKKTALHYATENRHYEIANLLLGRKSDPNAEHKWKVTPLMKAAKSGDAEST